MSVNVTLRLDDDLHGLLVGLGEGEDRSLNWLINDAVRRYVDAPVRPSGRVLKRGGVPTGEGAVCSHPSAQRINTGSGVAKCGACGKVNPRGTGK